MQAKQFATHKEILNQPQVWQSTIDIVTHMQAEITRYEHMASTSPIIFTGCGSPYYLAQASATVYRHLTGRNTSAHPGSNIWLFPQSHLTNEKSLLLCVSRSGETTEVLEAIKQFKAVTGGDAIAITCYPDSSIAQVADLVISLPDAQEISLAQTQSFTSMLIANLMTIAMITGNFQPASFADLPQACQSILDTYQSLALELGQNTHIERVFFLGSDALYGIACEAMLKMKEMSLTYAEAFHILEFRHGPKAMVNNQTLVVGMVSEQAVEHESAVLREMREMGATTLAISPVELAQNTADHVVMLPQSIPASSRLPLYLPIPQLIAYHRTIAKGLDPDNPANLSAFVDLSLSHTDSE